jgi:hypothetical protein
VVFHTLLRGRVRTGRAAVRSVTGRHAAAATHPRRLHACWHEMAR